MDGHHIPKRYRNKGKGRGKDKQLIRSLFAELIVEPYLDHEDAMDSETDIAYYCYAYGPCERCQEHEQNEKKNLLRLPNVQAVET